MAANARAAAEGLSSLHCARPGVDLNLPIELVFVLSQRIRFATSSPGCNVTGSTTMRAARRNASACRAASGLVSAPGRWRVPDGSPRCVGRPRLPGSGAQSPLPPRTGGESDEIIEAPPVEPIRQGRPGVRAGINRRKRGNAIFPRRETNLLPVFRSDNPSFARVRGPAPRYRRVRKRGHPGRPRPPHCADKRFESVRALAANVRVRLNGSASRAPAPRRGGRALRCHVIQRRRDGFRNGIRCYSEWTF